MKIQPGDKVLCIRKMAVYDVDARKSVPKPGWTYLVDSVCAEGTCLLLAGNAYWWRASGFLRIVTRTENDKRLIQRLLDEMGDD